MEIKHVILNSNKRYLGNLNFMVSDSDSHISSFKYAFPNIIINSKQNEAVSNS